MNEILAFLLDIELIDIHAEMADCDQDGRAHYHFTLLILVKS